MPAPPSTQLAQAAQRLADLEQRRAAVAARLEEAKQARSANLGRTRDTELAKLQDRIDHAVAHLQRARVDRATQLGKLEKAERLLASCERQLQNLALGNPGPGTAETPRPADESPGPSVPGRAAPVKQLGPEEARLKARVAQLEREAQAARAAKAQAQQALVAARARIERMENAAAQALTPAKFLPLISSAAVKGLDDFLEGQGLPPANRLPGRGEPDTRFSSYLERFTNVDSAGIHRLEEDVVADHRLAFSVASALYAAVSPVHLADSMLMDVLGGAGADMRGISAALRGGGANLEAAVRAQILGQWDGHLQAMEMAARSADTTSQGPRHGRILGVNTRRTEMLAIAARCEQLARLQQNATHRQAIIDGAVSLGTALLGSVLSGHGRAQESIDQAKAELVTLKASLRPAFAQAIQADQALNEAQAGLQQLGDERRQREAADVRAARAAADAIAKAKAGPTPAAIPQTTPAPVGTDEEARLLKLRGDIEKHTTLAETARQSLAQHDEAIREAERALRRAEDQYETADTAQARGRAGARRQHTEQRQVVGSLRRDLDDLEAQVEQARTELDQHPSRRALISDRAWERAVQRHVEPDDAALRARIRAGETGRNGAYGSRADLALAAADIHAHLSQQPAFQAVLAARSRAEFERAAASLPSGVTDLVHDHGREVGRGFSSAPDQTERPTPLTQSSFSLLFVQGRVVVSHLYPFVPHRQLTTAV